MKASVIIPTYNGEHKLPRIFKALSRQSYQDFELIIGVDGSTDNTIGFLKKQTYIPKDKLIVYTQTNQGRSVIRNNAAKLAKHDLLIFYDDDMEPQPNSIEKHIEFHKKNNNCILGANLIDKYSNKVSDFLKYKEFLSKKWTSQFNQELIKLNKNNLFVSSANFSISKSLFFLIKGFDERLTDAEDWDFA